MSQKSNVSKSPQKNRDGLGPVISDFKLTLISNSILVSIIAYLLVRIYKKEAIYTDCNDYFRMGFRQNGIYEIQPNGDDFSQRLNVYCNMTAGGWTVLFRKSDKSSINFQNSYQVYKNGFGDLNRDHFLGLENFHLLTKQKSRELTAVLNDTNYRIGYFKVLNEFSHFKLIVDKEIDKFPDQSSLMLLNNSLFSTFDLDYDLAVNSNCSSGWKAGWWFTDCFDRSMCLTCLVMHGDSGVKRLYYSSFLIR
ncbi:angiopoietin-related 4-like [Brachionus plicatilis]|uniref:Angiopoietin-related 4-like n=1 Tax=Brachionus plicatilis TaxID=10195 RepID=A0A3M7QMI6_BRAPC|nr:angiopoietin-related 4-like [Brachionus plicatilis]